MLIKSAKKEALDAIFLFNAYAIAYEIAEEQENFVVFKVENDYVNTLKLNTLLNKAPIQLTCTFDSEDSNKGSKIA